MKLMVSELVRDQLVRGLKALRSSSVLVGLRGDGRVEYRFVSDLGDFLVGEYVAEAEDWSGEGCIRVPARHVMGRDAESGGAIWLEDDGERTTLRTEDYTIHFHGSWRVPMWERLGEGELLFSGGDARELFRVLDRLRHSSDRAGEEFSGLWIRVVRSGCNGDGGAYLELGTTTGLCMSFTTYPLASASPLGSKASLGELRWGILTWRRVKSLLGRESQEFRVWRHGEHYRWQFGAWSVVVISIWGQTILLPELFRGLDLGSMVRCTRQWLLGELIRMPFDIRRREGGRVWLGVCGGGLRCCWYGGEDYPREWDRGVLLDYEMLQRCVNALGGDLGIQIRGREDVVYISDGVVVDLLMPLSLE